MVRFNLYRLNRPLSETNGVSNSRLDRRQTVLTFERFFEEEYKQWIY